MADVTPFVEAHVRAQRLQVEALSLKEAAERQLWQVLEDIVTEDLAAPPRLADALFDAFFGREVTNRYYRGLADVSVATATNDLARLEASGLVRATGAGRSAAYVGTEALVTEVARAASLGDVPSSSPIDSQRAWLVGALAERVQR